MDVLRIPKRTYKWQDMTIYFCIGEISLINNVWKKFLSPTIAISLNFDTIIKSLYWCSEFVKQHQKWICNPQNPIIEVLYIILWQVDPKLMSVGGHIGFMQITKIAQRVHKGNQAEILLGPPRDTNQQKNVTGKNISRSPKFQNFQID